MAGGDSGLGLTLLSRVLAVSALKMPLLRKGPITDGHGHVPFVAEGIYDPHALPHGDLVEAVVYLGERKTDRIPLLKQLFYCTVKVKTKPVLTGRGCSFLRRAFQQRPGRPHPQQHRWKAGGQRAPSPCSDPETEALMFSWFVYTVVSKWGGEWSNCSPARGRHGAHSAVGQHSKVPALCLAKPWQCHCPPHPCAGELPRCDRPLVCSGSQQPGQGWTLITLFRSPRGPCHLPPLTAALGTLWTPILSAKVSLHSPSSRRGQQPPWAAASWVGMEGAGTGEQLQRALCHCSWPQARCSEAEHGQSTETPPEEPPLWALCCNHSTLQPLLPTSDSHTSLFPLAPPSPHFSEQRQPSRTFLMWKVLHTLICPDAHLRTFSFLSRGDQHERWTTTLWWCFLL